MELCLWLHHLGRCAEEFELFFVPLRGGGRSAALGGRRPSLYDCAVAYFGDDFFKVINAFVLVLMSGCLALRTLLWLDSADARDAIAADAFATPEGSGGWYLLSPGALALRWRDVQTLMQLVQSALAVAGVATFFRFLGTLSWASETIGEEVTAPSSALPPRASLPLQPPERSPTPRP